MKPGVPETQAEAALDAMARQIEREQSDPNRDQPGRRVQLHPGGKLVPMKKEDLPAIAGFFAVLGGVILLIASSNVANMMMARAADRRKEISIRLALGAGRARLIRQLLTESLVLAAAAGAMGYAFAWALMRLASQETIPYPVPPTINLEPDGRVMLFTFVLTAFTALACGLIPALADYAPRSDHGSQGRRQHATPPGPVGTPPFEPAQCAGGFASGRISGVAAHHGIPGDRPSAHDGRGNRIRSRAGCTCSRSIRCATATRPPERSISSLSCWTA